MESEITFLVEESLDGGYEARALGHSIFTQGETLDEVKSAIREAVECHFEPDRRPHVLLVH
ncbi:MAG: 2-oxoisovalerate dehydrogenase [Candidatus Coatesbacteria bacterium]